MLELHIPFANDRVRRHLYRANSEGERVRVYRVTLNDASVGYGESPFDESKHADSLLGQNPLGLLQGQRVSPGWQMALYDAVGRATGLPAHRLLGPKVRDRVGISWWAIDMDPDDWAAEVTESVRRGYTSAKLKGRPWRDLHEQLAAVARVAPKGYAVYIDFNGFLLDYDNAMRVVGPLEGNPLVVAYESPFYLDKDVEQSRRLTSAVRPLTVEHFREKCLHADCLDAFLIDAGYLGAMRSREIATLCRDRNKPFWLQMVGTGITTAFMAHLAATLPNATLPSVTCHELLEDDLLTERLEVKGGLLPVPDGPGLGVTIDEAAIARYRVEPGTPTPRDRWRQGRHTLRITIPRENAAPLVLEYNSEDEYYKEFLKGQHPVFVPGVTFEVVE